MRNDVLAELLEGLEPDESETPAPKRETPALQQFLEDDIVTDKGAWSLVGREPLRDIIALINRVIVNKESGTEISILGAEQWGKTFAMLGSGLHLTADYARNVGYFLPTDKFASKFGRTRLKRVIERSPYLSERLRDASSGDAVNQATIKEFDGNYFYLVGLETMTGAISTPMDAMFFDEVDLLPADNMEWAKGRVAASDLRLRVYAAAGYVPGGGIDERWQEGTQHKWLVDCPNTKRCRTKRICLEESFPDCMARIDDKWERVCPRCGTKLDVAKGRWVATHPERVKLKKYSFRVSSMAIAARDADHIMDRWSDAKKKKKSKATFDCAERAIPNAGALQPIDEAELKKMRRPYPLLCERGARPRYAGLDMGDTCHLYVEELDEHGRPRVVWIEAIDSDDVEKDVPPLISRLGIVSLVVDFNPLRNTARAIARSAPTIVRLAQFEENKPLKPGQQEHQGKKYEIVVQDRNDAIEEFATEATDEKNGLIIPDKEQATTTEAEVITMMEKHFINLRKDRTVLADGRARDRYIKSENHFGLAATYARLARMVQPLVIPFLTAPAIAGAETSRREQLLGYDEDGDPTLLPLRDRREQLLGMV